jgi:prepilin-type N-terminal cleavage/methylation domain-containing protein
MNGQIQTGRRGVTMIELLIVMAMLGVVMTAMYSLYATHQRSAYTEDEALEVQQSLRIALDSMTRDIRMAGFAIAGPATPVNSVGTSNNLGATQFDSNKSDSITINTTSTSETYARIDAARTGLGAFTVDSSESVDMFSDGDLVTIVRPQYKTQPGGAANIFRIKTAPSGRDRTAKTITLEVSAGGDINAPYNTGDVIARLGASGATVAALPNTITYCLGSFAGVANCGGPLATCPAAGGQLCLMRIENVNTLLNPPTNLIASNMSGLQLRYLLDDLTETDLPVDFSKVRAVRVTLTGQTAATAGLSGQARVRQVQSVIQLRNR